MYIQYSFECTCTAPVMVVVIMRDDDVLDAVVVSVEEGLDIIGPPESAADSISASKIDDGDISIWTLKNLTTALSNRKSVDVKIAISSWHTVRR